MSVLSSNDTLFALSPLDGRYAKYASCLRPFFSEAALISHRVEVEITWFIELTKIGLKEVPELSQSATLYLRSIIKNFSNQDAENVKEVEKITNHDVKAVEYWLKNQFQKSDELRPLSEFIHFACTSEDINNTAYALMICRSRASIIIPILSKIENHLLHLANIYSSQPMLSRTHGQPASPTTLGKEFANVISRLRNSIKKIQLVKPLAKMNGATGNYNAHIIAYPNIDWQNFSKNVLNELGLIQNRYTIQIEPHDWISELLDSVARTNLILVDLSRDLWGYISLGYFKQKLKDGEIGSSTMPHKVNPIDFENCEGNLGLANAMLKHLSEKLPVSRWQRDLTDSTVLRSLGVCFGYSLVAWNALLRGLEKLELNLESINSDINSCWEVLAEPIQTIMRKYGLPEPYERLKLLTRGKKIDEKIIRKFVDELELPIEIKQALCNLSPRNYIGLAEKLAKDIQITDDSIS